MLKKARIKYWVDVGLVIAFIVSFATGIIKFLGLYNLFGVSYSKLPMNLVSTSHDISGVVLGLLVLAHIILHFKWMIGMTKNFFSKKAEQKGSEDDN